MKDNIELKIKFFFPVFQFIITEQKWLLFTFRNRKVKGVQLLTTI